MMSNKVWRAIACKKTELRLDITLACGQSFRWKELVPGEWTSVLRGKVVSLRQDEEFLYYRVRQDDDETKVPVKKPRYDRRKSRSNDKESLFVRNLEVVNEPSTLPQMENMLRDYFRLEYSLHDLYKQWSDADKTFKDAALAFSGIRLLRQDPVETLFSFICSSNNHISRISSMVNKMCETYGSKIMDMDGESYHSFPTVESLAKPEVEDALRKLGFGYRAKYINATAKCLTAKEDGWLLSLRDGPYQEAKAELMKFSGIGAKVADCICLMSLDKLGVVPVDTHVWQIALQYIPKLKSTKSLTPAIYNEIGDHFRASWGELAGWAHLILFSAELNKFKNLSQGPKAKTKKSRKRASEETSVVPAKINKTTSK